jgi:hypothetical protein
MAAPEFDDSLSVVERGGMRGATPDAAALEEAGQEVGLGNFGADGAASRMAGRCPSVGSGTCL